MLTYDARNPFTQFIVPTALTMSVMFLVFTLLSSTAYAGQFTGNCSYSHSNTGDPVAYPDDSMRHLHDFLGNTTTDEDSTLGSLRADRNVNCDRKANKSSYWVPRLYWGQEEIVPTDSGVYYQTTGGLDASETHFIPEGFKMIAYSRAATMRSDGANLNDGAKARVYWHCNQRLNINESKSRGDATPPLHCPNDPDDPEKRPTLGVTVEFPECWNGKGFNVRGGANMRHAVKDGRDERCPAGFPKHIPQLNMAVDYTLPSNTGPVGVEGMHGMVMGANHYHADYFNVEDTSALTEVCIRKEPRASDVPDRCRHGG